MLPSWISSGVENQCFYCLLWICGSGSIWQTQVSSCVINLQWKSLVLALKRVRNVLRMSTICSLCSGVSNLGTHLAGSLLISKVTAKTMWIKAELMHTDLAFCWTVRLLSSKPYVEWHQLAHLWLKFMDDLTKSHLLCSPNLVWISQPTPYQLHRKGSPQQVSTLSSWISLGVIPFFCRYLMTG